MASSARVRKRPKTEQAAVTAEQAENAEIVSDMMYEHEKERQAWRTELLELKTKLREAAEEAAEEETAAKADKDFLRKEVIELRKREKYQAGKIKELRNTANARDELLEDALYFEKQLRKTHFEVTRELKDLAASTMDSAVSIDALHASIHALHAKTSRIRDDKTVCRDLPKSVI